MDKKFIVKSWQTVVDVLSPSDCNLLFAASRREAADDRILSYHKARTKDRFRCEADTGAVMLETYGCLKPISDLTHNNALVIGSYACPTADLDPLLPSITREPKTAVRRA